MTFKIEVEHIVEKFSPLPLNDNYGSRYWKEAYIACDGDFVIKNSKNYCYTITYQECFNVKFAEIQYYDSNLFTVYHMNNQETLAALFLSMLSINNDLIVASSMEQIGWIYNPIVESTANNIKYLIAQCDDNDLNHKLLAYNSIVNLEDYLKRKLKNDYIKNEIYGKK